MSYRIDITTQDKVDVSVSRVNRKNDNFVPNCIDVPAKRYGWHWKQFERARFPSYNRNRSIFGRMLNQIYDIGIQSVQESIGYQQAQQRAQRRITNEAPPIIESTYRTVYENTAQEFALGWQQNTKQSVLERLVIGQEPDEDEEDDTDQDLAQLALLAVRDYLTASMFSQQEQTLRQHVQDITSTHAGIFSKTLEQQAIEFLGLDPGQPVPQMDIGDLNQIALATRSRLRSTVTPKHSQYFSTTETVGASNLGILAVARAQQRRTGQVITKGWLSQRDSRVRDDHVIADGQQINLDGLFNVGGSRMAFPGDWTHGADISQTINCRCVLIFFTNN